MELINRIKKNRKGFTLVEIIVVLVILAILAAFTIPTMLGFVNDAKGKAHIAQAREVYVAAQAAATEKVATDPSITEATLEGNLSIASGKSVDDLVNTTMKTMLTGGDIPAGAFWAVDVNATNKAKVDKVTFTIDKKVITITPGNAAVVTDVPTP
ncbi:type II secretion system protein [Acetobacterium carbinolicum]|uniref:type II secretion system protein n=1 Tax=Acetobacterium carbinolicum TaxID=52690 RepID=UPI0039C93398